VETFWGRLSSRLTEKHKDNIFKSLTPLFYMAMNKNISRISEDFIAIAVTIAIIGIIII